MREIILGIQNFADDLINYIISQNNIIVDKLEILCKFSNQLKEQNNDFVNAAGQILDQQKNYIHINFSAKNFKNELKFAELNVFNNASVNPRNKNKLNKYITRSFLFLEKEIEKTIIKYKEIIEKLKILSTNINFNEITVEVPDYEGQEYFSEQYYSEDLPPAFNTNNISLNINDILKNTLEELIKDIYDFITITTEKLTLFKSNMSASININSSIYNNLLKVSSFFYQNNYANHHR